MPDDDLTDALRDDEGRRHDLPPFWDGLAVVWGHWRMPTPMHICPPPPPTCCPGCGSQTLRALAWGRVARVPAVTHDAIAAADGARARLPHGHKHRHPSKALRRLVAMRCTHCRTDEVHDRYTGEWWVLDASDYLSSGSRAPLP